MNHLTIMTNQEKIEDKTLSAGQKKFNRLTKSIQKNVELIKKLTFSGDELRQKYTQCIYPLLQEIDKLRMQTLILLDQQYHKASLTKRQSDKLYDLISSLAEICVDCDDSGQAEEIYNRYNDTSLEDSKKVHSAKIKAEMEEMLNIDLGDDFNFDSEESFWEFINTLKEKQEKSKKRKDAKKEKITTKQKIQIEQELFETQSIKEIFRQLTKVLHPDREMDEKQKERKSELMQRANIYYNNKDLLALLELQFEIEQANQSSLDKLSNDKLDTYNRLLQKKLKQTKDDIETIKAKISRELNIPFFYNNPDEAYYFLNKNRLELENQKKSFIEDLEVFNETKSLKKFLNALKINNTGQELVDFNDVFFF